MKRKGKILDILSVLLIVVVGLGSAIFAVVSDADQRVATAEAETEVNLRMVTTGKLFYGDRVVLAADVVGMQGEFELQWQENDGSGWRVIDGASGREYAFILTGENSGNSYRVVLNTGTDNGQETVFSSASVSDPQTEEPPAVIAKPTDPASIIYLQQVNL